MFTHRIRSPHRLLHTGVATALAGAALGATARASAGPEAALAQIEVTVREGTNMAAAVSPDGSTIAMDVLGRIWVLPIGGGTATPLTDELGDARQPSWSPDGSSIVFQAYWDGNFHVWAVAADGEDLRQLTFGPFDDREPQWSPDGLRVLFSSDRSGNYDLWELDVRSGVMTRMTDDDSNEFSPAYAPTGGAIAFVTDRQEQAGVWIREPGGVQRRLAEAEGTPAGPSWSPDGSRIAYNEIGAGASHLRMVDLTGAGARHEAVADEGEDVFPFRVSWLSDSEILYTSDGRLRRRRLGGPAQDVAFEATVTLDRPTYSRRLREFGADGSHPVRGIVSPAVSPDGSTVTFVALGDLWLREADGSTTRLTDDGWVEADPAWSPDGSKLVFASDRAGSMDLWLHDVETGTDSRLTEGPGAGLSPVWSPDGTRVAFLAAEEGPGTGGITVVDVATGQQRVIRSGLNNPGRPSWSPDGRSLAVSAHQRYSTRYREGVNRILLISIPGSAADEDSDAASDSEPLGAPQQAAERWLDVLPHTSIGSRATDGPVWSPDGRWMAYVSAGVLWALPVSPSGDAVGPPRRLTNGVADDPTWTGDSKSIVFLALDHLERVSVHDGSTESLPIDLEWNRAVPTDRLVIHAGALFDGSSPELARNVDIVVVGNRIVRVDAHQPGLHRGRVMDAGSGVVAPGLIEMHAHQRTAGGEALGRTWLSWGVTSVREPAADPYAALERRESVESGRRPGPRTFITGGTVDGSRIYYSGTSNLQSGAQLELELGRADRLGYDVVKTYVRLPDVAQKRVVAMAHERGLPVTSHELYPAVAYGADGVEHVRGTSRRGYSPKVTRLNRSYQDVVELLTRSGMTITPTVGISGAFGVLTNDDPTLLDDPRVEAFVPPGSLRRFGPGGQVELDVRRGLVRSMASTARRVVEGGGRVIAGTDSPIIPYGLSLHAELQSFVEHGGMSPLQALRTATSVAAEALGHGDDLGTVEPGKLADLIILERNPLEDIRATRTVRTVIKNGIVYESDELLQRPGGE